MAKGSSNNKVANGLVTASFGAIVAVYSAGYLRTQAASERFASRIAERRVPAPAPTEILEPADHSEPASVPPAPSAERAIAKAEPGKRISNGIVDPPVEVSVNTPAPSAPALIVEPPPAAEVKVETPVAPTVTAAPPPPVHAAKWKDGTYRGWGYSRHGDVQAEVVIEGGRILSAVISDCQTRYSCSVIDMLPPQVAKRQSPDVDFVSGATQSADAFYGAVVEALGKAK